MSSLAERSINSLPIAHASTTLHLTQSRTPNVIRQSMILRPQSNTYATDGDNCVRWLLPKRNCDFRDSFCSTDVTLTTTGGTYKRLPQLGGASMIDRIRVFTNNFEQTDEYYNRIANLIYHADVSQAVKATLGQDVLGFGTQADRNADGAIAGSRICIPILVGLFQQGVLPLQFINTGAEWNVEFYLAAGANVIETDGTNPQFSTTNWRWDYSQITSMDGSYEARVQADVASGRLQFGYGARACFQNPVINTQNDIQIPWRGNALTEISTYLVDQSTISDPTANNKFITWLKTLSNNATVLQYQIQLKDGVWLPVEPVDCTQDALRAYMFYLQSRGLWNNNALMQWEAPIASDDFNSTSFLMVNNLNSIPTEAYSRDYYFNNLSTMKYSQNVVLRLTLSAVPPQQTVAYSFVNHGVLLDVKPDGRVERHV